MRLILPILFIIFINSCHPQKADNAHKLNQATFEFKALAPDGDINGSILVYDLKQDKYYSNDFNWAKVGRIPASTFKIPHSLIALELGIIEDKTTLFN